MDSIANTEHKGEDAAIAAVQRRILRGIDLYAERGDDIEWVDDRCYVPSATIPGKRYLVIFTEDGETCKCPDRKRKELGVCKHSAAALVSWARRTTYHVEKSGHPSQRKYTLVQVRAGVEREILRTLDVAEAYHEKWRLTGYGQRGAA